MNLPRFAFAVLSISVFAFGCAASSGEGDEGASSSSESAASSRAVCGGIAGFTCPEGQKCIIKADYPDAMGFCVGPVAKPHRGDCVCSGGYMSATYCSQFGAPWTTMGSSCVWPANSSGGLTAEQCASVGAKHGGDGSGSDIYNLGVTCSLVGSGGDCSTSGCGAGQYCAVCKTVDGPANVCLPNGAVC